MINAPRRFANYIVNGSIKHLTGLLCSLNVAEIEKIPLRGPLIIYGNHINFLDVPLMITRMQGRPITGLVKTETWGNPCLGPLFSLWGGIPLRRGEADAQAFQKSLAALAQGKILALSPEGTRSGNGALQPGRPGIALLAMRSGAPLMPLALWGQEFFHGNVRSLRRTPVHIRVGSLLRLEPASDRTRSETRQAITEELMYHLASLLPPAYRGVYAAIPEEYKYVKPVEK